MTSLVTWPWRWRHSTASAEQINQVRWGVACPVRGRGVLVLDDVAVLLHGLVGDIDGVADGLVGREGGRRVGGRHSVVGQRCRGHQAGVSVAEARVAEAWVAEARVA